MHPSHAAPNRTQLPMTGATVAVLLATAGVPLVLRGLGALGIWIPYAGYLHSALGLASVVLTLVFLHGAFKAMRGRTSYSPGMAVAGWFIPLANLFLPALILRDGIRAAVGKGGGVAFLWMIAWWLATASSIARNLGLRFSSVDKGPVHVSLADETLVEIPGISLETFGLLYEIVFTGIDVAAYGLLALMVATIGRARA